MADAEERASGRAGNDKRAIRDPSHTLSITAVLCVTLLKNQEFTVYFLWAFASVEI